MNRRKAKDVRMWASHLALRLRKRGSGYSMYDGVLPATKKQWDTGRVDPRQPGQRADFKKLSQAVAWLGNYSDAAIKHLSGAS